MTTKKPGEDYDTIVVACYTDVAKDIKVGTRYIVAGKQKSRSGKTWQIILKPFAARQKEKS